MKKEEEKREFLRKVFNYIRGNKISGNYAEFGVYKGSTFIEAVKMAQGKKLDIDFLAFDSFEGLPGSGAVWEKGDMACSLSDFVRNIKEVYSDKIKVFKGLFQETLKEVQTPVAVAWIDGDLYESAVPVLDWLTENLVDGGVVIFDDWFFYRGDPRQGEHKAFDEWIKKTGLTSSEFQNYSWKAKSFIINR